MFGLENFGELGQAVELIGIVLVEAIVLYIGYGVLEEYLGPKFTAMLRGE
jgi:Tfp pilus assembly protein PilO